MSPTPTPWRRFVFVLGALLLVGLAALGVAWRSLSHGGMRARQSAPGWEKYLAAKLVDLSIPSAEKSRKNPLSGSANSADASAGLALYRQNCETCHGSDGAGRTVAGGGLYPPPIKLRDAPEHRTDGELFFLIRNGVRNTGMPAWSFSDRQIWQLVTCLRHLPITAPIAATAPAVPAAHFVGSASCADCHADIYRRWIKTPMANVIRDPREHPDAIIPDLTKPDPLLTFTKEDIAFTYGSKWKQRYFKKVGDDYFPYPAQWDVTHAKWRPYFVKDDWWASLYPPDNFQRPTGPLCDGCHSVNYDLATKKVTEWNVGCEKCHGPGSEHVKTPKSDNILNAARLGYVPANDVCISCHSQGRPLENPIAGRYYDWPVGYQVGGKLHEHWKLEEHKLGATTFTHFADGTAHKNRMQGNDYVTSRMYAQGVTCFTCHDAHGTDYASNLRKPASTLCLDCHGPTSPNGPRAVTLDQHTHHRAGSTGSECIACHMPKIAQTIADVNVRSHTFRFITPAMSDAEKIPNACTLCHADKSSAWATAALTSWSDRSPWRAGN